MGPVRRRFIEDDRHAPQPPTEFQALQSCSPYPLRKVLRRMKRRYLGASELGTRLFRLLMPPIAEREPIRIQGLQRPSILDTRFAKR